MGTQINLGSLCTCMYGVNPLPILPVSTVLTEKKPAATVMDMPTGIFGVCNSPFNPASVAAKAVGATVPCAPAFIPPWIPGSPQVLIGGKPALNNSCRLFCGLGGPAPCISLTTPGAVTVQI